MIDRRVVTFGRDWPPSEVLAQRAHFASLIERMRYSTIGSANSDLNPLKGDEPQSIVNRYMDALAKELREKGWL